MKLLANENFPLESVHLLRKDGHDVSAMAESGSASTDLSVLQQAAKESRAILTFDRDCGELVFRYKAKVPPALLYFRFDPFTPEEPYQILAEILKDKRITLHGKFTVVERAGIRQRSLVA